MVVYDFNYSTALAFNYQEPTAGSLYGGSGYFYQQQPQSAITVAATQWTNPIGLNRLQQIGQQQQTQQRSSMKRELSDTDPDDAYDDGSDKGTPTPSTNSCQMLNRKKRRGIIEKKRRDRINNSLSELRRLVPTAFEKQGSAKLEKAEILQMTVDHLKMLSAKGFDAFSFDPHKFAMDYHGVGFRECAAEVARYLVTVEGLDVQDPLRLRLMSHLQCFSTQRDHHISTKSSTTTSWNSFSPVQPSSSPFNNNTTTVNPNTMANTMALAPPSSMASGPSIQMDNIFNVDTSTTGSSSLSHHMRLPPPLPPSSANGPVHPHHHHHHHQMAAASINSGVCVPPPTSYSNLPAHHLTSQYHNNSFTSMSPVTYSPTSPTTSTTQVKPYRPWGTELAY
ncbi:hypothetical protein CHUAL_013640 [Chamberlinius hualienensis]